MLTVWPTTGAGLSGLFIVTVTVLFNWARLSAEPEASDTPGT